MRTALNEQNKTVPNQKGKPPSNPTDEIGFQLAAGIHRLIIQHLIDTLNNIPKRGVRRWALLFQTKTGFQYLMF
ncbi:MAG: hypothetical protein D6675_04290 [Gemmatimonadetes bacterium]|nr:MAG: hypothetical protein D6675_04290 [Gemmatimonadota bacterium]